ncbi:hypothetical protein ABZ891_13780 [Streptomyces sp. NPDC047023]|uniref:hypothetical protein n=1 Tax=Streptomyces sp. NPDC047023 TaxID=3155139 RepID=UPI0033C27BF6
MRKYVINKEYGDAREVEAQSFSTVGEFVDFHGPYDGGDAPIVLRVRADRVFTIELTQS